MNSDLKPSRQNQSHWRQRLHEIIFEADTPLGKAFDVGLILSILLSVAAVMAESVTPLRQQYGELLVAAEWFFSFFGVVDLLAILPTYLSLLLPGTHYLLVIRILRILRVFRVLKLVQYLDEARLLMQALRASSRKIQVFLFTVVTLMVIFGSLMYLLEGESNGFTSIPRSIYWTIVTMTTVGYGDISPQTELGQMVASVLMILGYGIIAVPTGIVTVEMSRQRHQTVSTQACPACGSEGHGPDARFCKDCGAEL
jgi:voltage-gated potassium channel